MAINEERLNAFLGKAVGDLGAAMSAVLISIGDTPGYHRAFGRVYYGASSLICVPVSLARNGRTLGAQAGERRLRQVVVDNGGFTCFRRASETPFNIILEAHP